MTASSELDLPSNSNALRSPSASATSVAIFDVISNTAAASPASLSFLLLAMFLYPVENAAVRGKQETWFTAQ